jgi:hypothetical protein
MNLERIKKALTALLGLGVAFLLANASGALGFTVPESITKWIAIGIASLGLLGKSLFGWVLPGMPTVPVPKAMVADVKAMTAPPLPMIFALFLLPMLALSACAHTQPLVTVVTNALPEATAYAEDASLILTGVETFEKGYYTIKPNAEQQKQVEVAIARARSAIDAGLRICMGIKDLSQSQIGSAFSDFQRVYQDVIALLGPLGAHRSPPGSRFGAGSGGGYAIPDPLVLALGSP